MILLTPSTHEQAKQEVQEANGGVGVQGSEEGEEEVSRCRRKERRRLRLSCDGEGLIICLIFSNNGRCRK